MDQKTCVTCYILYIISVSVTSLTSNIPCTCLILLEHVQYQLRSYVTKFEPDLTCLATVRALSVNMLHVYNFDFDLTGGVIVDLEVNEIRFRSTVDSFGEAIKRRLNFENRTSSFGDRRGALNSPPPQSVALWHIPQSGAGLSGKPNTHNSRVQDCQGISIQ